MRHIKLCLFLLLILLLASPVFAQINNNWYIYHDVKKEVNGYKDSKGKIKILARFNGLTSALVFRNIIAVSDAVTNKSYYLLKSGKKVGTDSLYVWDMSFDCEQEGKIRFRDNNTDKVGFFGTNGKVAIPAKYSDARPFYNGLAVVLHHGKRICAGGGEVNMKNPCEHWSWDGITAIINSRGQIVADSLDINKLQNINWYSRQIGNTSANDATRVSIKAKNGTYYSFINYEKEFNL